MELTAYGTYQQYKQELDTELRKTTEGFVRIGYLLKVAKDTDILRESGYANVYEFAQAEYNIEKSQVSRFMSINDRFSEGGYSDRLKVQFQGFGHAKLTIMLQLPDEINEELTPEFSKSEIQAIKEEYDAESRVSDLEVLMEGEDTEQKEMDSNLYKVLHQLGKEEPELYVKLFMAGEDKTAVQEALAPDGEKIYSIRIMGVGRLMLSVKDLDKSLTLTNMRTAEKEEYTWAQAMDALSQLMHPGEAPAESWEHTYGEKFPEKPEVAPVQQNTEKKAAPKRETKVQKAQIPKKPELKTPEPVTEPEEQIPGQDNVLNHPEYLPESPKIQDEAGILEENPIENVTKDSEIVEMTPLEEPQTPIIPKSEVILEQPAAVMEESEDWEEEREEIWGRMELNAAKLNLFIQDNTGEYHNLPKERWRTAYQNAITLAADLERMMNHG